MTHDHDAVNTSVVFSETNDSMDIGKILDFGNVTKIWQHREQHEITLNAFFLMLIILTALGGNTAVIYAIMKTPKLREHNSNLFIINLSVTDMSSAVVVMCTAFTMLVGDYRTINQAWCDICCATNYILIIVSMLTLAFISIDRYFAVIHPLTYNTFITKGRVQCMISWAWIQGVTFGIPPVIKKWVHYDYWEVVCAIAWHDEKPDTIYYVVAAFVICFAVPGIIMVLCYTSIIKEAKPCRTGPMDAAIPKGQRSATKTIRSLLIVVALFFICMSPFCVTKLLKVINTNPNYVPPYANLVASYMGYMSSVINPFIYGIFRADFRAAYKHFWWRMSCKCFGSQPTPPALHSSFFTDYTRNKKTRNSIFSVKDNSPSPLVENRLSPRRRSLISNGSLFQSNRQLQSSSENPILSPIEQLTNNRDGHNNHAHTNEAFVDDQPVTKADSGYPANGCSANQNLKDGGNNSNCTETPVTDFEDNNSNLSNSRGALYQK